MTVVRHCVLQGPAWIAACVLSAVGACGPVRAEPSDAPPAISVADMDQAVRDLGHDDFSVRQRATHRLWQAGEAAESSLREAARSHDPEVASRARWILDRLRFGHLPDTPPQLAALIEQFRTGSVMVQRTVLKRLIELGRMELAARLLQSVPEVEVRAQLHGEMAGEVGKSARRMIAEANLGGARQLIEFAAQGDSGRRDLAAFFLLQGELKEEIARRRETLIQTPNELDARLLGYLLRADGDLPTALHVFDKSVNDAGLVRGILLELGDWQELAKRWDEALPPPNAPMDEIPADGGDVVERLGMAAAFHRLAGNDARFFAIRDQLREAASLDPRESWHAAKAILIAGQIDDAMELLAEHGHTQPAFDLLAAQMRFDEAFQTAGMSGPQDPFDLSAQANASAATGDHALGDGAEDDSGRNRAMQARFTLGLSVAQTLQRLGWVAEAEDLFNRLAAATADHPAMQLRAVCRAEREVGLDARAFQRAAAAIDEESTVAYLSALFPKKAAEAIRWWTHLADQSPESAAADRFARVHAIVDGSLARPDLLAAADAAEAYVPSDGAESHAEWLIVIGQLRLDMGDLSGARRCFEEATKVERTAETLVRLADYHWSRRHWKSAADAYATAITLASEKQPESYAHLLYLRGCALHQTGDETEGNRLMAAARLLPLGDARVRHALAEALRQRNLTQEAARQWTVILRTGEFNEWAINDAAKQLGNTLGRKDGLLAANYWQRLLLSCAKRDVNLVKADGYLKLIQLIHRLRARALLENGDSEQAVHEARLAHAALPGDTPLVCDLVPRFDEAGLTAEADGLFEAAFEHLRRAGANHPHAAELLNNAAWMAATCNRRLDDARELAQQATDRSPDNPAYLDTLAEVLFRRGDRQAAIELARRCVELAPETDHYQKQLARFIKPEQSLPQ